MANTIKIKRSAVSGKVPTTTQLELGELAVNTHDGKLYTKKDDGTAAVVQIGDAASTADALSTARSIALSGDVSGSTSFDGSANVTITATVADDSHNHVISNVDGLQTALDAKLPLAGGQLTGNITFSGAQTVDGRDLSVDGAKLDGIASGATNVTNNNQLTNGAGYTTNTGTVTSIATSAPITGGTITGTGTIGISAATTLAAGSMSAADKSKLDGIASGATNVTNNNQLTNGAGYITSSGSITGNAATATTLQTARTINGVSFNGSANITVESYVENDESTNATRYLTFVDNTTAAYKRLNEDSSLTYNPSSNVLSAGTFSGSGASLSSLNASNLSSGTVPSGRLSGSYGISVTGSAGSVSNTLSRGSYLTGSNFNGSAATTWAVDATTSSTASKIVARDGSGHIFGNYIFGAYLNMSHSQATRSSDTIFYSSNDSYLRKNNASGMRSSLSVPHLAGNNTFTLAQRGQVDALSSASTITPNFNNSNNFSISLSTNTTIANPSNLTAGQSGAIAITYNGGYTVAFGSYWKFPGGTAPTATSTSGKTDVLVYYVESSTRISAQLILNTGG